MDTNNFIIQKNKGVSAQEIVKEYLTNRGNTIIDVSEDKEYQPKDIDFLVEKGGNRTTLEIKGDMFSSTGNFYFEIGADRQTGYKPGWLSYCEAVYICFMI